MTNMLYTFNSAMDPAIWPVQPFAIAITTVSASVGLTAVGPTMVTTALPAADPSLMSMVIEPGTAHVSSVET